VPVIPAIAVGGTVNEASFHARLTAVAFAGVLALPAAQAEPFLTRNQNPLLAVYGLPSPLPARLPDTGRSRVAGVLNWSNDANLDASGSSAYTMDAEAIEARLHIEHSFWPKIALRAELPWRRVSGGSLDGFIEDWHDFFGLPNGSRDRLPRDELLIEYRVTEATLLRLDESTSGVGDIPLSVGYQLHVSDTRSMSAWLTVKAPLGDASDLTGSGAVDVALSVSAQSALTEDWDVFGQVNAVWLGDGDLLPQLQESAVFSALAGITWSPWRTLDLTVQFEGNSRVFDGGGTDLSGAAILMTFGGSYRTQRGWQFDLGISEDIDVGASPDIAFNVAARRRF
jgi:hypothetical protein